MSIPYCFNYKGHTVYEDGRVYRDYELIGTYATVAAAKAAATRNYNKIFRGL